MKEGDKMFYVKPVVEIVKFEQGMMFMTVSPGCPDYFATAQEAVEYNCTNGYDGGSLSKFQCTVFGGVTISHNGQNETVTIGNGTYVFNHHGNHWSCVNV